MPYKDLHGELAKRRDFRAKLKSRYDLSLEDFEHMLALQDGVCAICKRPENDKYKRRLSVDHDHETGKIRGLLCHMCNTALGKLNDDPELFSSAARYLRLHRGEI